MGVGSWSALARIKASIKTTSDRLQGCSELSQNMPYGREIKDVSTRTLLRFLVLELWEIGTSSQGLEYFFLA